MYFDPWESLKSGTGYYWRSLGSESVTATLLIVIALKEGSAEHKAKIALLKKYQLPDMSFSGTKISSAILSIYS